MKSEKNTESGPHVGLFVTCLVDLIRPSIGFATIKLLETAGCKVTVPENQTCCGQPAYNSGDNKNAADIAKQVIVTFEGYDYIVIPSGSCGGMIKHHYPDVLKNEADWARRAKTLSAKTFELTSFLFDVLKFNKISSDYNKTMTYHDSCSGLRELGIRTQPRELLSKINRLSLAEGKAAETCCGFGGLFCVKYPDISEKMVDEKVDDILQTGAELVLGGDLGCLMNISGRLTRRGHNIEVRHIAEVLAAMTDGAGIGAPSVEGAKNEA